MATWRNGDPPAPVPVSVTPGRHRVPVGRVLVRLALLPVGVGVLGVVLWLLNDVMPQYAVVVGGIVADERDDLD